MSNKNMGPAAPKDPTKKRDFFYIMKDKEIFGAPQPDGRFVHFLYMDFGRLTDAARLTGNVTDEETIQNLTTRKGLQKMVHSIGVSVSSGLADKQVKFIAEMYPNVPGEEVTVIETPVTMDGMEVVIDLSEVDWKDGDKELGQIRFVFEEEGIQATTDVRFYLNGDEVKSAETDAKRKGNSVKACATKSGTDTGKDNSIPAVTEIDLKKIAPVIGADFEDIELLDRKELHRLKDKYKIVEIAEGSFDRKDTDLQAVEMDKEIEMTPEFPHNWCHPWGEGARGKDSFAGAAKSGSAVPFRMTLTCKKLLLTFKDSAFESHGTAEIFVDGKPVREADPHVNGWTHCNAVVLLNEEKSARREIEIRMKEGCENKKFTILGFGVA